MRRYSPAWFCTGTMPSTSGVAARTPGVAEHDRQQLVVQLPANLEVSFARGQMGRRAEAVQRTAIGNLDGQKNRHPERDAQNIQPVAQRMPPRLPNDLPPEESEEAGVMHV